VSALKQSANSFTRSQRRGLAGSGIARRRPARGEEESERFYTPPKRRQPSPART